MTWKGITTERVLQAWDTNEPVWSCDMGGMGPGYEQCIQIMAFEMLRAMHKNPPEDWAAVTGPDGREAWDAYRATIGRDPAVSAVVDKLGPSGAQHGAAMNIAAVFARNGYEAGMEMVPEDRRIMVSREFPSLDGKVAS